jgi:hypothetical protein
MKILVTAQILGEDNLLFDIYSDSDNFTTPVEINVTKQQLLDGFLFSAPSDTVGIKVVSIDGCGDSLEIVLTTLPSLATTTTTTTTTTTSTTTLAPTLECGPFVITAVEVSITTQPVIDCEIDGIASFIEQTTTLSAGIR